MTERRAVSLRQPNFYYLTCRLPVRSVWCCRCQVYTFGCNDHLALGRDAGEDECLSFYPLYVQLGCEVIAQVSAGDSHTAVLSREGRVYIWGAFRVCTCFRTIGSMKFSSLSACAFADRILQRKVDDNVDML